MLVCVTFCYILGKLAEEFLSIIKWTKSALLTSFSDIDHRWPFELSAATLSRMNRRLLSSWLIVVFVASTLSAQSLWKEQKNPGWKSATGVQQYESLLWRSVQRKDWLAVESHIASNFVYQDAAGTKDKAQHIADLKQMTVTDGTLNDANVTPSGNHAILTYVMGGNRYMSIWQQQKSGWVQVAMSVTSVK